MPPKDEDALQILRGIYLLSSLLQTFDDWNSVSFETFLLMLILMMMISLFLWYVYEVTKDDAVDVTQRLVFKVQEDQEMSF